MIVRRVLIATGIYPPAVGGPATFARTLVEGLPHHAVEPDLLAFTPLLRLPRGLRHAVFLAQILARGRSADLLMALDPISSGLPTLVAARALRKPFVLRLGGDFAWEQATERFGVDQGLEAFQAGRHGLHLSLLRRAERFVARQAARVMVPDRSMRRLAQGWGVAPDRIIEVGNAVDLPALPASRQAAKRTLGVEGRLIVSMGRLIRLKGFEGLIDVVADVRQAFPDLRLVILGSGPQHDRLAAQVLAMHLGEIVELAGALPRTRALAYLKAADLFVLNSAGEGQANAILEAMAVGTPVIATRAGGTLDLIEHGRNGWLVGYNARSELHEALRVLLQDPARAARLAAGARLPPDRLDPHRLVRNTLEVLRSAA